MIEVNFTIDGKQVHRALDFAAEDIGNLKKPMDEIASVQLKTFDLNFGSRGDMFGGWAPRKPRYSGGRRIDTWPLLERTGNMRKNFKKDVGNTFARLYNPTSYFRYHQQGTERIPQRVMMTLREQDGRMIVTTLQNYCIEVLRRRGLR